MKKIAVLVAALSLVFAGSVFAEKYVSANDLDVGELTSDVTTEDGFVLHATAGKSIKIQANNPKEFPSTVGDETYTKRINLGGTGSLTERSISINAKAGQTLKVYAKSAADADRVVNILDGTGAVVASGDAVGRANAIPELKVKIPADGDYYVASKSSGINVFEIDLE